ncbi:MAG: response regulator [Gammaproteobacteria bacterium]|nr:response regulator [Gammaproteobacteria bacterium]
MSDAIEMIRMHVGRQLATRVRPLYLAVDDDLRLLKTKGNEEAFGMQGLGNGTGLDDRLPFLLTAEHRPGNLLEWSFVELPNGTVCHVHALALEPGWAVALLDASEEHDARQQRQQVAHELLLLRNERERLITELEEANRLKGEFIARMSHEFRTPLASVIGYSDELRELRRNDTEVQHHLAAVGRGARHLLNLVENLLDQASIEVDRLSINASGCDLQELSDDVEQLLRPVARQKQLSLAWWFDGSIPGRVWLDATRLKQVLTNLVGNAIKFTRSGSVNVEFNWSDDRLHVSVEDTGPGIAESDMAHIFEPFHQSKAQAHGKGAGLGLAISRTLIEAMGGEITLQSQEGRGTRFDFSILAKAVGNSRATASSMLLGRDIVLADDDTDMRDLLRLYLSAAGCKVHALKDAADVSTTVRKVQPAVVLLDLDLGDQDGTEIASALRGSGYRGRIVALSGSRTGPIGENSGTDPFDARWSKPISRGELLAGLAELIVR